MKKLLVLTLATFSLHGLACSVQSTTGKPLTPEEARRYCPGASGGIGNVVMSVTRAAAQAVSVESLRAELSELMVQHNQRIQGMNNLLMNELPQRYAIEQMLFQRQQLISRLIYVQNALNGPLHPMQRQQAMYEFNVLQMNLTNGDGVLNQFIRNYNYMYGEFWRYNKEANDLNIQIQNKQAALNRAIEQQRQTRPTPERLAQLESEKAKLEKGKEKLLALTKEAEATAQRAQNLQNESAGLMDELSDTLNWKN